MLSVKETNKKRILLAEDESSLSKLITLNLQMEGYEVSDVVNGKDAITVFHAEYFDLIILDVMMPEINGYEVCEQIRLVNQEVPVLFLTAKNEIEDRVHGLRIGANDYLAKPFGLEELLLRVANLIALTTQRKQLVTPLVIEFGGNKIDLRSQEAITVKGTIPLTQKELAIIKLLFDKKNQVVSRKQIFKYVWGYDVIPSTRTVDNFILSLRKYFEKDYKRPQYIKSVHGVGYQLVL